MKDLTETIESICFKKGSIPDAWEISFEGIHINLCIHPLKGIVLSYCAIDKRKASEGELSLPASSNKQQLAQAMLQIHEKVYGN